MSARQFRAPSRHIPILLAVALVLFAGAGMANAALVPLAGVKSVSVGATSACAVVNDDGSGRTARCWGSNAFGELGNNSTNASTVAVPVQDTNAISAIAVGGSFACALRSDGVPVCWGYNAYGQIGVFGSGSIVPVPVNGGGGGIGGLATALAVGYRHACALRSDGSIVCWGDNSAGQLGNGVTGGISVAPVQVSGISTATGISAGVTHTCALLASGGVECWGNNAYGQLGTGNQTASSVPVAVAGLPAAASAITVGDTHTCAIVGAAAYCWGRNLDGQLGNGNVNAPGLVPASVNGLSTAKVIAGGGNHTCGNFASGATFCWGNNQEGELGNGNIPTNSSAPVAVSGLNGAVAIAAGSANSCAVLSNATAQCWGEGSYGALGNGNSGPGTNSGVPVTVLTDGAGVTYTVSPSAGPNGAISPATPQTVASGSPVSFTIAPNPGYRIDIAGTCGGTLTGSTQATATFAIAAVTADCTLVVTFVQLVYRVTPSAGAGGSISPATPQSVVAFSTASFTVAPNVGYVIQNVAGTCGIGGVNGAVYTTNPIAANCTVTATFVQGVVTPSPMASAPALSAWALSGLALLLLAFALVEQRVRKGNITDTTRARHRDCVAKVGEAR